jgi:hypothetical protein
MKNNVIENNSWKIIHGEQCINNISWRKSYEEHKRRKNS